MSGYLPPHSKEGPQSKTHKPAYPLEPAQYDADSSVHPVALPSGVVPTVNTVLSLGTPDFPDVLKVPVLGFGLWPWGDSLSYGWGPGLGPVKGYDQDLNEESVEAAFDAMFQHFPKVLIDTAEHYAMGLSESLFGDLWERKMKEHRERLVCLTKYLPTPWRHPWMYPDVVVEALGGSLSRLRVGKVDIYQLHGPSHFGAWPRLETICIALAEAYRTGNVQAVGVCNFSEAQVQYIYEQLKKRGVPLVSNQVEFSLLRMDPWKHGMIDWCRERGITTIAYSPLGVGRLTGKYSAQNPPRGNRNFGDVSWSKIQPILDTLEEIGSRVHKTPAAVALNWVMCKGAIPIPGVKNAQQVEDCVQALGWRLSKEDEAKLDKVGLVNEWDWKLLKHMQNWWWQQG